MSIQFQCSCGNTLRVKDEHAGKAARCPNCQTVNKIPIPELPADGGNPFAGVPLSSAPPSALPDNPYAPSSLGPAKKRISKPATSDQIRPTKASVDRVLSVSWELWKNNLGLLVGVCGTVLGIVMGLAIFSVIMNEIVLQVTGDEQLAALAEWVVDRISGVLQMYLGIGQIRIYCDLARGRNTSFGKLFSGGDKLLPTIGASIVGYICLVIGLILLIVPGILMLIMCWSFLYFIADDKAKAMESFSLAYQCGSINMGTTFLIWLISIALVIVGFLALGIGIIFAVPLISMLWAVTYLMITGQLR